MLRLFACVAFMASTIFASYTEAKEETGSQEQIKKTVAAIHAIINKSYPFSSLVNREGATCIQEKMIFDVEDSGNALILMPSTCNDSSKAFTRYSFNFKNIENKSILPVYSLTIAGGTNKSGLAVISYDCDIKECADQTISNATVPDSKVSIISLNLPDRPKIIGEFQQEFGKLIALFKKK